MKTVNKLIQRSILSALGFNSLGSNILRRAGISKHNYVFLLPDSLKNPAT